MEYVVPHTMQVKEALSQIYPDSSRRSLKNWLKLGRFTVGGKKLEREDEELAVGTVVSSLDRFDTPKVPGLKILYEDRYLIAIEKPVGMLAVPLDDEEKRNRNVLSLLRTHYNTEQIYAVHRLDKDVSGVLVFARGKDSENKLKALFERHDLHREYFAIVEGRIKEDKGVWNKPLLELPSLDVVPSDEGKEAITHYKVIRRSPKFSYLEIVLETGRKHQIRVHCQTAGYPILGDFRYGALQDPIRRIALHARKLELVHPFTKKRLKFSSPIPRSFSSLGKFSENLSSSSSLVLN